MNKYQILECLGDGSYGVVHRAINLETQEPVAIKIMKEQFDSFESCLQLREVKALIKLKDHPNVIKLKNIHFEKKQLFLIFEYLPNNIYQMYQNQKISEDSIKQIILQSSQALNYIHQNGYFHRDLKPENILIDNGSIKIIDFGLARDINSHLPFTDYVATRWYRAPEILLHSSKYTSAVDMFALGCIMCELYLARPLFTGTSELDQFNKLSSILGPITIQDWQEGYQLIIALGIQQTNTNKISLNQIIKNASNDSINLIENLLCWNPKQRLTADQVIKHPFFNTNTGQKTPEFACRKINRNEQQQCFSQLIGGFKQFNIDTPKQKQQQQKK